MAKETQVDCVYNTQFWCWRICHQPAIRYASSSRRPYQNSIATTEGKVCNRRWILSIQMGWRLTEKSCLHQVNTLTLGAKPVTYPPNCQSPQCPVGTAVEAACLCPLTPFHASTEGRWILAGSVQANEYRQHSESFYASYTNHLNLPKSA